MTLTVPPEAIDLARARQIRMLAAMADRDASAIAGILSEGPRLEFERGVCYRIVVFAAPPVPPSNPDDPVQAALGIDHEATARNAAPIERILRYQGRLNQPPGHSHLFTTLEVPHSHAVIADIDVLAFRREGES